MYSFKVHSRVAPLVAYALLSGFIVNQNTGMFGITRMECRSYPFNTGTNPLTIKQIRGFQLENQSNNLDMKKMKIQPLYLVGLGYQSKLLYSILRVNVCEHSLYVPLNVLMDMTKFIKLKSS